jgi:hypothetical protein
MEKLRVQEKDASSVGLSSRAYHTLQPLLETSEGPKVFCGSDQVSC